MKAKIIVAAVAMAMAGSASAAIQNGYPAGTTNPGELFLNVWDSTAQLSYTRDLGIQITSGMIDGTSTPAINVPADSTLNSFIANAKGSLQWNLGGLNNYAYGTDPSLVQNYGIVSTIADPVSTAGALTTTALGVAMQNGQYFTNSVNGLTGGSVTNYAENLDATDITPGQNGYFDSGVWGVNWGSNAVNWNDTAAMGSTMHILWDGLGVNAAGTALINQYHDLGSLTLKTNGDLVSSVPVPAAAWLFGSGLVGLVGVGRRKAKSA